MKYAKRFIYPPRPKNMIQSIDLVSYDDGSMISQIKSNGSNCVLITNGKEYQVMNRHGQRLTNFNLSASEIKSIYSGDGRYMVLNAEYLNKNKNDETGNPFNHKLIIFDILVNEGDYLVGRTFENRINLLDNIYGKVECKKDYLYQISENIYRNKSYDSGFQEIYDLYTPIDFIEGLVLKRKNSRLEVSASPENNWRGQVKCRKGTKNYKY